SDADPGGVASDYDAVIDWGDGTGPSGGSIQANGSSFQVSGGHTYTTAGSYTVTITVTDQGGANVTISTTATVTAPTQSLSTPSLNAVEGQSFSGNVALFTPANPNLPASSYSVDIGWGDGS